MDSLYRYHTEIDDLGPRDGSRKSKSKEGKRETFAGLVANTPLEQVGIDDE